MRSLGDLRGYFDVVVVGGGAVGVFTALDLALRGVSVLLLERGRLCSGTSGRSHGMLHSGARYATTDPEAARECIRENRIISEMAPHCVRDTGGIFVSVRRAEEDYHQELASACLRAGIPVRDLDVGTLKALEPHVSPDARSAALVPDKVVYARELVASTALLAVSRGASIVEEARVCGIKVEGGEVVGIEALSDGELFRVGCKGVVNAAGPWCGRVAELAGVRVGVLPAAGVMGVTYANLTRHIINRMRPPSDGDIIVPYGPGVTISGTTAVLVEDPDRVEVGDEDARVILQECGEVIPALRRLGFSRLYASVRPLVSPGEGSVGVREITRSFEVIDHSGDGARGLVTALGGKLTTARLEAERAADLIAPHIGASRGSFTEKVRLDLLGEDDLRELADRLGSGELGGRLATILREALDTIDAERYRGLLLPLKFASMMGASS
ncbi:Anaerobic glycerol-3-phosphate dehydrogenase subunit A [Candidatus Calditenuaceae archaeon HR02]|nr:Anaerobic glycerol-3-phosphate dehydrogenase subunit A [Candidatus Calditenuaceae archaeon HR02]